MPWLPIGFCVLGPSSGEVPVGRFAGELLDGALHLRIAYHGPGDPDPMSFLIVDFLSDSSIRSIGSEKFWPRPQPAAVRLGPCPEEEAAGRVLIKARSFNRRRLLEGLPSPSLPLSVQAYLPAGVTFPRFVPAGIDVPGGVLGLVGSPVGPGGAYAVGVSDA